MDPSSPATADLLQQLAATTGPIGTMLAIGFMWIKNAFTRVHDRQDRTDDRLDALERPPPRPLEPAA